MNNQKNQQEQTDSSTSTQNSRMAFDPTLKEFTDMFLQPPKGNSPEQIAARIRHWVDVANAPEAFVAGDASPYAISAKRRSARQNLGRLLKRYPDVAKSIMQESEVVK
jgi:hypothetical protein